MHLAIGGFISEIPPATSIFDAATKGVTLANHVEEDGDDRLFLAGGEASQETGLNQVDSGKLVVLVGARVDQLTDIGKTFGCVVQSDV